LTTVTAFGSVMITLRICGVTLDHFSLSFKPVTLLLVLTATVLLTLIGILPAMTATARVATPPAAPAGWTTVFNDTFAGSAGAAPSLSNWFYDIGDGRQNNAGEVDQTTRSTANVYLDGNGHLVLKATRSGGSWTSGRLETTREDFMAPAGGELEMTASIKLPAAANALGYWPAFWAIGAPKRAGEAWPMAGELDMMEDVNGQNAASQALHDAAGITRHKLIACTTPASGCNSGYHTYSVIINRTNRAAEYLQFLMDGKVREKITEATVGATAWKKAIHHGFFIILDLAVGGTYPDEACRCTTPSTATTSGASMKLGYVAVYEKGGNSTPTSTVMATGRAKGLNGWCVSNRNSLDTTANVVDAETCGSSAGQRWSAYSDRTLRTQGGCLGFWGDTAATGTWVDWYPCNGTAAQAWKRIANGEIVNQASGLCLTVPGGQQGVQLDLEPCLGTSSQRWSNP
jgi:beta-glucanase (GH16 family)